jgi:hypothetical protein
MPTSTERRFHGIELSRAIEGLYDAFEAYPLRTLIDFCPHCQLDAAERQLQARPLRELGWADLRAYCPKAITAFGDAADFKHFLPRILELYVTDHRGAPCCLFVTFGKLEQAAWASWPVEEVAAVRTFIDAWKRVLANRARESEDAAWELDELKAALIAL